MFRVESSEGVGARLLEPAAAPPLERETGPSSTAAVAMQEMALEPAAGAFDAALEGLEAHAELAEPSDPLPPISGHWNLDDLILDPDNPPTLREALPADRLAQEDGLRDEGLSPERHTLGPESPAATDLKRVESGSEPEPEAGNHPGAGDGLEAGCNLEDTPAAAAGRPQGGLGKEVPAPAGTAGPPAPVEGSPAAALEAAPESASAPEPAPAARQPPTAQFPCAGIAADNLSGRVPSAGPTVVPPLPAVSSPFAAKEVPATADDAAGPSAVPSPLSDQMPEAAEDLSARIPVAESAAAQPPPGSSPVALEGASESVRSRSDGGSDPEQPTPHALPVAPAAAALSAKPSAERLLPPKGSPLAAAKTTSAAVLSVEPDAERSALPAVAVSGLLVAVVSARPNGVPLARLRSPEPLDSAATAAPPASGVPATARTADPVAQAEASGAAPAADKPLRIKITLPNPGRMFPAKTMPLSRLGPAGPSGSADAALSAPSTGPFLAAAPGVSSASFQEVGIAACPCEPSTTPQKSTTAEPPSGVEGAVAAEGPTPTAAIPPWVSQISRPVHACL